jgi:uncharacterized protein (DUF58 family)
MIRPAPRLVVWFGLVVLPLSAVAGLAPALAPVCVGGMALFAVLVAVDGVLARRPLRGLGLVLPPVLRLTKDRQGLLPILVRREESQAERTVRLSLALPETIDSPAETLSVRLPGGASACALEWACTPRQRGRLSLPAASLEAPSPLGFWDTSRSYGLACELRCYPNLAPERRHLAGLFLNREGLGSHPRRQVGQGRDFEKLRDYQPGDSFEDIHWRATAKRGRPITREYQIEKTQEIYVVVDASRMSARRVPLAAADAATADAAILDVYIRTALVLGLVARRQGDRFGLVTFGDRVRTFLRAGGGRGHFDACRDALYTLQAAPVSPDFDELGAFLRTRIRRRALLLFLTSLDDPLLAEGFLRSMAILGSQHLVVAAMLRPMGAEPLFGRPVEDAEEVYGALAGHLAWEDLRHLGLLLRRRGVLFHTLTRDALCADLVSQYLAIKQRQLL